MKLQHDFLGNANRLRGDMSLFDERVAEVRDHWRDGTADEFQQRHLQPMSETLRRLQLTLQEAAELASRCGKILSEEEYGCE